MYSSDIFKGQLIQVIFSDTNKIMWVLQKIFMYDFYANLHMQILHLKNYFNLKSYIYLKHNSPGLILRDY